MTRLLALVLAVCVASCGSGQWIPPGLGLNRLMAVPQPFKERDKHIGLASAADASRDVAVTAIAGLEPADTRALISAIARAADASDILVESRLGDRRTSLLEGAATLVPQGGGRAVSITFNWRRPDGTLGRSFQVGALDSRSTGQLGAETIAALGRSAALELAVSMNVTPVAAATARPRMAPVVFIALVKGANAKVNKALTTAISVELSTDGVDLTADRKRASLVLAGLLDQAPADQDQEIVKVTWRLLSPAGAELARVEQANTTPRGALGRDGDMPYDIASAAAEGLLEAMERISSGRADPSTGGPVPSAPPR